MSFVSLNNHLNPSLMNNDSNEFPTESEENYVRKKSVEDLLTTTQEAIGNLTLTNISNINVLQASTSTSTSTSKVNIQSSSSSDSPKISSGSGSDKSSNVNEDSVRKSIDNRLEKSTPKIEKPSFVDTTDKPKSVSKVSERAKKKSWYSAIYPSYKSRTEDFKRLFKSVADDERLVVDYSCALQREILVHGRLYISQNYLCFYANIFGWETCLTIKLKDVTSVIKDKTAKVIPNAISVWTQKEKYFFTSFTTRDKAYLLLFRVWQNALLDKPMQPQELWQSVHNIYGDELGLTSDDEDYIDPNLITEKSDNEEGEDYQVRLELMEFNTNIIEKEKYITATDSISEEQSGNDQSINNNNTSSSNRASDNNSSAKSKIEKQNSKKEIMKVDEPNSKPIEGKRKVSKNTRQRDESLNQNSEALPTDMSDSSDSDQNKVPFVSTTECTSNHEGRQLVHTILPINIDTLFNLLFSKSKFLLDFHVSRKTSDAVFNDWITDANNVQTRTITLTATLTQPVGPKTSRVTETQVMRECSKPGELYSIDCNCVNAGIPYADSFYVLTHYCLVKTVDDNTMLSVHSQIKYKKYILGVIKGLIEKNAWTGLEDHFGALLRSLQSETCIPAAKSKGRKTRRGTTTIPRPIAEDLPTPAAVTTEVIKSILPSPIKNKNDPTNQYKWISCFVIILLFALIFLNVILLLKLWNLEKQIENDSELQQLPKLTIENLPNNNNDWIKLLQQQEALHETEMKKWNVVLQTAIELLKKTEKTLASVFNINNYKSTVSGEIIDQK